MDWSNLGASEEDEAAVQALILSSISAVPMVLKTAIELDLLELIAKQGPEAYVSPSSLAAQLPTQNPHAPDMLDRILRLLSTFSILKCRLQNLPDGRVERLYGLAPVCKFFTKNADGVSFAPVLLLFQDKVFMETWHYFKEAILEGGHPFKKAYGMDLFEFLGKDPKISKDFNKGMSDTTVIIIKKILETYNGFKDIKTLIDVGGGVGVALNLIVSKYPTIKGINFDLPHVIQHAPTYPGVEHVSGDMFAGVPQGDAILLKGIIHDWDDDKCVLILKRCHESLPEKGKVILAEFVLPEWPGNNRNTKTVMEAQKTSLMDVLMLAHNPGAKERTEKEFQALGKAAGFNHFRKIFLAYTTWILELHK